MRNRKRPKQRKYIGTSILTTEASKLHVPSPPIIKNIDIPKYVKTSMRIDLVIKLQQDINKKIQTDMVKHLNELWHEKESKRRHEQNSAGRHSMSTEKFLQNNGNFPLAGSSFNNTSISAKMPYYERLANMPRIRKVKRMRQIRTTPQMQVNLATNSDNPLDNGEVPVLTSAAMNQSYSFDTGEHVNREGSSSPHQQYSKSAPTIADRRVNKPGRQIKIENEPPEAENMPENFPTEVKSGATNCEEVNKEVRRDAGEYVIEPSQSQAKRRRQISANSQIRVVPISVSVVDKSHSSTTAEHRNREESSPPHQRNSKSAPTIADRRVNKPERQIKIENEPPESENMTENFPTGAKNEAANCEKVNKEERIDAGEYVSEPSQSQAKRRRQISANSQIRDVPISVTVVDKSYSSTTAEHRNREESSPPHQENAKSGKTIVNEWAKKLDKLDESVTKSKEQIKELFPQFLIRNIRLFDEYDELREKFVAIDSENGLLFQLVTEKAEALKLLENILRYTELVFFEVKRDALRRSERNYTNWAEEQRRQLFAKHPVLKLDVPGVTKANLLQFFNEHQSNVRRTFFHLLSEDQTEMLEKSGAKAVSVNI